jgi:hypothetical protein
LNSRLNDLVGQAFGVLIQSFHFSSPGFTRSYSNFIPSG